MVLMKAPAISTMASSSTTMKSFVWFFTVGTFLFKNSHNTVSAVDMDPPKGEDCPNFECMNGSNCEDSSKAPGSYTQHPWNLDFEAELSRDGKHCACLPGFTGLRCATPFESCGDSGHTCYYGGTCLPGLQDIYGNDQQYCDCSNAVDDDGNRYAGKYCENKAIDVCDEKNDVFCVRGGRCKDDFYNYPRRPCWCKPDELDGPHCEYDIGSVPECTLDCQNNGICRHGLKTLGEAQEKFQTFWADNQNYMYCECKDGFFGHLCEVESVQCGSDEGDRCFNGGSCVYIAGESGTQYQCDCSTATGDFAGKYCEDGASDYCDPLPGSSEDRFFCVNGGRCTIDDGLPTCHCQASYNAADLGPKCEFVAGVDCTNPKQAAQCTPSNPNNIPCDQSKCKNGSECSKGAKDNSKLMDFIQTHGASFSYMELTTANHDSDMEHCICPVGYTGLYCNIEVTGCPKAPDAGDDVEDEILCFHGSSCRTNSDGSAACDCSTANTRLVTYAGDYCQHESTAICTDNGEANGIAFCVNYGSCVANTSESQFHPGCNCPSSWTGDHCEIAAHSAAGSAGNGGGGGGGNWEIFAVVCLLFGIGVLIMFVVTFRKDREHFLFGKEMDSAEDNGSTNLGDRASSARNLFSTSNFAAGEAYRDSIHGNNGETEEVAIDFTPEGSAIADSPSAKKTPKSRSAPAMAPQDEEYPKDDMADVELL